ncbi:MAG: DUF962 domain-containing protein [Acidobacteria bacterium]|nr:MAG: DUF962 domain-containing protein [Acidobacteriota bacterium]REK04001.1 MAG: DUF962 domain-containing protein [Acidobacteriota bacterium]REK15163.1 MAG: DUF962 domain-containing protein [Acidobacteriota bacterium]REK46253.1 MAG: DUF962 domain-containing protein [Acidobacteriota bacterium]
MSEPRIDNYSEFWDFYVLEHSKPMTRYFHFVGTLLGMVMLVWFVGNGNFLYIPLCFVVGYAFAWFSHFFIEKNKPATFKYPGWSFVSDYKMAWLMMTGRMEAEVERVISER